MSSLHVILRNLWGLFVDDGNLALALVLWCAIAGLVLPRLDPSSAWNGPVLFLGCLAILIINVARSGDVRKL
jgi:hypothetical protein